MVNAVRCPIGSVASSIRALPGEKRRRSEVDHGLIQIDMVIRTFAVEFAKLVPTGWTLRGSGRSRGIRLRVPDFECDEDFRIDLDRIVAHEGPGAERLRQLSLASLASLQSLQRGIIADTGRPWPPASPANGSDAIEAHAESTTRCCNDQ